VTRAGLVVLSLTVNDRPLLTVSRCEIKAHTVVLVVLMNAKAVDIE
jgi:hypothetical protein